MSSPTSSCPSLPTVGPWTRWHDGAGRSRAESDRTDIVAADDGTVWFLIEVIAGLMGHAGQLGGPPPRLRCNRIIASRSTRPGRGSNGTASDRASSITGGGHDSTLLEEGSGSSCRQRANDHAVTTMWHCRASMYLLSDDASRELASDVVREVTEVVGRLRVRLPYPDPWERITQIAAGAGRGKPSMLVDMERGQRTEIDYINGAVVRAADQLKVPVPVNATLTKLVRMAEAYRGADDD